MAARARSSSVSSTRSLDPEVKAASEAKAREKIAALKLMVYTEGGALAPYVPAKTIVEAIATRIRSYNKAKETGSAVAEKRAALQEKLDELVEKVAAANLSSAKKILKRVHGVEARNENAGNVREFHEAMVSGNAGRRNAAVARLAGLQEMIKAGKKTMKAAKVGAELATLRNAGFAFNNKYKLTKEDHAMIALLGSEKAAKSAAAREHFAEALAARHAKLSAKAAKSVKEELLVNSAALAGATAALGTVAKKVDPKNAERYARMLALAAGSGLDIQPMHYYTIFREAFKTRRAKKGEKSPKAAAGGAGAGAGAAAALAAALNVNSSS